MTKDDEMITINRDILKADEEAIKMFERHDFSKDSIGIINNLSKSKFTIKPMSVDDLTGAIPYMSIDVATGLVEKNLKCLTKLYKEELKKLNARRDLIVMTETQKDELARKLAANEFERVSKEINYVVNDIAVLNQAYLTFSFLHVNKTKKVE
jgi:hypothetical protein